MSQLLDLFKAVQEPNLTKTDLEDFHTRMTGLYADIVVEAAELTKAEAIYFLEAKEFDPTLTDVLIKRRWNASTNGLRLISLKAYEKATNKLLSSIKNRIYASLWPQKNITFNAVFVTSWVLCVPFTK